MYRDLLVTLVSRDLKLRYKQTMLGVIWVVLQPLLAAGIFSIVFGVVAGLEAPGNLPYFVFSYAGLLAWNLFSNVLTRTSGSLVGNAHLISKVFFPRLILPLASTGSALVDFAVAGGLMVGLMFLFRIFPGWPLLLLPLWGALLLSLALGIGLCASALAVSYRDINYILPVFTQMLLYATPVAYALENVPEKWRILFLLNPLTGLLEGCRWSLLGEGTLQVPQITTSAAVSLLALSVGAFSFKRMERKFADVI
jgi:lipopolysaccharide transport system permease protein